MDFCIAIGIPFYVWAKKQNNPDKPAFTDNECGIALALAFVALFGIYALARGIIHV